MMVRPDEMSASSAPRTRPLKHCDAKFAQLSTLSPEICQEEPSSGRAPVPQLERIALALGHILGSKR